eukprot:13235987-Alexandrium_andersonii.AAC.1
MVGRAVRIWNTRHRLRRSELELRGPRNNPIPVRSTDIAPVQRRVLLEASETSDSVGVSEPEDRHHEAAAPESGAPRRSHADRGHPVKSCPSAK